MDYLNDVLTTFQVYVIMNVNVVIMLLSSVHAWLITESLGEASL